jgi:hypothetical protein
MLLIRALVSGLATLMIALLAWGEADVKPKTAAPACEARYRGLRAREMARIAQGVDLQIRAQRQSLTHEDLSASESEALEELDRILNAENRPVDASDLEILESTLKIFQKESRWKRKGREDCKKDLSRFTLSCALVFSSTGIKGDYVHFRPSVQEVRLAIHAVFPGRTFEHPIHQFNNDPATTIEDIRRVVRRARDRVAARLQLQARCAL